MVLEDLKETSELFTMQEFCTLMMGGLNKDDLFSVEIGQPLTEKAVSILENITFYFLQMFY